MQFESLKWILMESLVYIQLFRPIKEEKETSSDFVIVFFSFFFVWKVEQVCHKGFSFEILLSQ